MAAAQVRRPGGPLMPRAPKHCGHPDCTTPVRGTSYCPSHRNKWTSTGRTASSQLHDSTEWRQARRTYMAGATRCEAQLTHRCTGQPEQCDMIRPASQGGQITPHNLQAICRPCHAVKTRRERA
ncbi:HNH endonuclease [Tsukamurella sp. USMM236]|uniref:HNH endonuclease n=1 Tax=Tsukamurella sp. USMM236 TaxID=3081301 RepID=UPI003FCD47FD